MTSLSRQFIDDNNMVARYLADQLTDSERTEFETYYVEHPEILSELNKAAQLKSGLFDLHEAGQLEPLLTARFWWQSRGSLTMAASLMTVVLLCVLWISTQHTENAVLVISVSDLTSAFESKIGIAESRDIQRTRTSAYDATISLPRRRAAIELRIRPEMAANTGGYRVHFRTFNAAGTTILASVSNARTGEDGFAPVYLDSSKLSPGIYEISISADRASGTSAPSSKFLIELTAPNMESK